MSNRPDFKNYANRHRVTKNLAQSSRRRFSKKALLEKLIRGLFGKQSEIGLMLSEPLFGDENDPEVGNWLPAKFLAGGGFGAVGLWRKYDKDDQVEDELVIKDQIYREYMAIDRRNYPGLVSEAVYHHQLNTFTGTKDIPDARSHVPILRDYKYLESVGRVRMYLEYAAHGDLYRLIRRYRIWNMWLPELFLWHTFLSLAKAIFSMKRGVPPWKHFMTDFNCSDDTCLIHFDMKTLNVLLTEQKDPAVKGVLAEYPTVQLSDFGLSRLTSPEDLLNPHDMMGLGTRAYQAPEQGRLGRHWATGPANRLRRELVPGELDDPNVDRDADGCFGSELNIYGVGLIMWDLVTLCNFGQLAKLLDRMDKDNQLEPVYNDPKEHFSISYVNWLDGGANYSPELLSLIAQCLSVRRTNRIPEEELVTLIEEFMEDYFKEHPTVAENKLYFRGTEINEVTRGNATLDVGDATFANDVQAIQQGALKDLDDDLLQPQKDTRWRDLQEQKGVSAMHYANAAGIVPGKPPPFSIEDSHVYFGEKFSQAGLQADSVFEAFKAYLMPQVQRNNVPPDQVSPTIRREWEKLDAGQRQQWEDHQNFHLAEYNRKLEEYLQTQFQKARQRDQQMTPQQLADQRRKAEADQMAQLRQQLADARQQLGDARQQLKQQQPVILQQQAAAALAALAQQQATQRQLAQQAPAQQPVILQQQAAAPLAAPAQQPPIQPPPNLEGAALRLYNSTLHLTQQQGRQPLPGTIYEFLIGRHKTIAKSRQWVELLSCTILSRGQDSATLRPLIDSVVAQRANTTRPQAFYALKFFTGANRVAKALTCLQNMYG